MTTQTAKTIVRALEAYASAEKARTSAWFFKTGPGEYGEGERFIGVTMPELRRVAQQFGDVSLDELTILLASDVHEYRVAALVILVNKYRGVHTTGAVQEQRTYVRFYLSHLDRVNNWDLVDCSAPQLLGTHYLTHGGEKKLYALAKSNNLWRRRIAIVATHAFIRAGMFEHTFAIAELLVGDKEDLVHKATGWMLREVGKRDKAALEQFLAQYAPTMPRTMLRYAIEKFSKAERVQWMR